MRRALALAIGLHECEPKEIAMKKPTVSNNKKLAFRSLTVRDLTAVEGGSLDPQPFPRPTAEPSACHISCATRDPAGCPTQK
jgi:hypothetical protein